MTKQWGQSRHAAAVTQQWDLSWGLFPEPMWVFLPPHLLEKFSLALCLTDGKTETEKSHESLSVTSGASGLGRCLPCRHVCPSLG